MVDRSGNEVVAFEPRGILNVTTIATLIGVTATVPPDATDEERDKKLTDAIDNPRVHLANTRISAAGRQPLCHRDPGQVGQRLPTLAPHRRMMTASRS